MAGSVATGKAREINHLGAFTGLVGGSVGRKAVPSTTGIHPTDRLSVVQRFLVTGLLGYARSWAKNIVKAVLGRKSHFTASDVLFRVWLRQFFGGPKLQKITCIASTNEGVGSQVLMMMGAISFARIAGLTYLHTPFAEIRHADRPMPAWAAAWEAHFNLGAGEVRNDRDGADIVNYAFTFPTLHALFGVDEFKSGFDDATIREFRRRYYLNKSPRKNETLSVCVHARRPNHDDFPSPDVSDLPRLARVLTGLRSVLDTHGIAYRLRVFSQGQVEEFRGLDIAESALLLDTEPVWSMQEMIEADILVTTRGSFSYVTGLLCDGIILADAQDSPASGWLTYDVNGDFETEALARRLLR